MTPLIMTMRSFIGLVLLKFFENVLASRGACEKRKAEKYCTG